MKRKMKKLIGLFLAITMVASSLPVFAISAADAPIIPGEDLWVQDSGMDNVTLSEPWLVNATEKETAYLLSLDADKLLYHYYVVAGLTPKASSNYAGWETSNGNNFRGFTLGRLMAGLSLLYEGCEDPETKTAILDKIKYCINGLKECQDAYAAANPTKAGYLSAFPEIRLDNLQNNSYPAGTPNSGNPLVPFWIFDSMLTGIVDIAKYVGEDDPIGGVAKEVAAQFGEYLYANRTSLWTAQQNRNVTNIEYGGMTHALYDLFELTGNPQDKFSAERFEETGFLDQLANGQDTLPGKHANTQIPKFVGAMKRYTVLTENETYYNALTDEEKELLETRYLAAAEGFWEIVTTRHSYVTGGNSQSEHFRAANSQAQYYENRDTCETCNTYNMLRLTRELFKVTKDKKYADFYENTYTNAILSSQNPETGMFMYFQPMSSGYNKVYSTPYDRFWCCVGTGMESFSKLNDSLYFSDADDVYVNMYYSSEFRYADRNLKLTQAANMPNSDKVTVTIDAIDGNAVAENANVKLRVPDWCTGDPTVVINGAVVAAPVIDGGYIVASHVKKGDVIELTFPMRVTVHALPNSEIVAFKYGPVVLSVGLGTSNINATQGHGIMVLTAVRDANAPSEITIKDGDIQGWKENITNNLVRIEDSEDGQVQFKLNGTDMDEGYIYSPHYMRYQDRYFLYMELVQPTIGDIKVDGVSLPGFDPTKTSYTYRVQRDYVGVPQITVENEGVVVQTTVAQATEVPGTATVTAVVGSTTIVYTINMIVSPVSNNLEVWYKFDETTGTQARDASGNNYHATMVNGASFTGESASLAGSTSNGPHISLPRTILENVPADFTVSTWIKGRTASQSQYTRVFDFGPSGTENIMFLTARDLQFNMDDQNSFSAPAANRPIAAENVDQWMLVTVTREGSTNTLYVNGAQVARATNRSSSANRTPLGGNFYIGRSNWADPFPNMEVKDFRVYSKALLAEEVLGLFNGVDPGGSADPSVRLAELDALLDEAKEIYVTYWPEPDAAVLTEAMANAQALVDAESEDAEAIEAAIEALTYAMSLKPLPAVHKASVTPGIDGEEWAKAEVYAVNKVVQDDAATLATGEARILWDNDNLYVRVDVTDPDVNTANETVHLQDSVEVYLSEQAARGSYTIENGNQYRLSAAGTFSQKSATDQTDTIAADATRRVARMTADGYQIYLAIPLTTEPKADTVFTLDVQINDATAPLNDRTGQTTWSDPAANGYNSADDWGEVRLAHGQRSLRATMAEAADGLTVWADVQSGAEALAAKVVVAAYNNATGQLIAVAEQAVDVAADGQETVPFSFDVSVTAVDYAVKAFLWDETFVPLTEAADAVLLVDAA